MKPINLDKRYFEAVVKSMEGGYLADGYARISLQDKSVEFRGSFVPSLFLDTLVQIIRIVDGEEAECFIGNVYLSAPDLLRIINVDEKLLASVQMESLQKVDFEGTVSPAEVKGGMFQRMAERWRTPIAANIYAVSKSKIRFVSDGQFEMDQQLKISVTAPIVLKQVIVQVKELLLFGQEERTGYRCDIQSMLPEDQDTFISYLAERAAEENQFEE